jgi:uncharacterized protein YutE (UPF0331/DUF86 family)
MPELHREFILLKMKSLRTYLDEIKPLVEITFTEYKKDYVKRHAVEKLIELIVEIASDINRNVIEAQKGAPASNYYNTFTQLGELNILPEALSLKLAATTGLRNRLVHRYEEIDHKVVYHSAVRLLPNYLQYFKLIEKYLKSAK